MTAHERALQLAGTMSDTHVLMQLAEEGWIIDVSTLRKWRVKAGVAPFVRQVTAERLERCVAEYRRLGSVRGAARALKIDVKTMRRRLAAAGVEVGAEHDGG